MSELGEVFGAMREESQKRRANHRENSAKLLQEWGYDFETANGGAHLIVTQGKTVVDFWPGTGKWIVRKTNKTSRGVFRLRDFLRALK